MSLVLGLAVASVLMSSVLAGDARAKAPGKQVPKILIDPGHGGTNSGAPSVRRERFEKHVTLAISQRLAERLRKLGYEVHMTREEDRYLTLRQRGRQANEIDADLFISIHGNASESHSHSGYETFILTPDAVDIDSRALRRDSGRQRPNVDAQTALLLDDIERSTSQARAAEVAASIQGEFRKLRGKAGDRGVRQASMDALFGATMPAMLVEVGFIDHPVEGDEILDSQLQDKIADALARAIEAHADALAARR